MDDKTRAAVTQMIQQLTDEDNRLDESQKAVMQTMLDIDPSMDPGEAKIRTLLIGKTPDHMKPVPAKHSLYPKSVYFEDGRIETALDESGWKKAKAAGASDRPSQIHVDTILREAIKRHESTKVQSFAHIS